MEERPGWRKAWERCTPIEWPRTETSYRCSIYSVALQNLMRVYRKGRKSFRGDAENTQDVEKARKWCILGGRAERSHYAWFIMLSFIAKSNACTGEERVLFEGIRKIQTVEKRRETGAVLGDRTENKIHTHKTRSKHIKQDPNTNLVLER